MPGKRWRLRLSRMLGRMAMRVGSVPAGQHQGEPYVVGDVASSDAANELTALRERVVLELGQHGMLFVKVRGDALQCCYVTGSGPQAAFGEGVSLSKLFCGRWCSVAGDSAA